MPITGAELREILHEHATAGPAEALRRAQIHRRIQRARRRRTVGAGAGLAVVLAVGLAVVLPALRGDRTAAAPGHTTATLTPSAVAKPPTREQLDTARDLLLHRLAAAHLPTQAITINPDGSLTVSIAAKVPAAELRALVVPGGLTIRAVLDVTSDHPPASPVTTDPPATPEPTLDQVTAKVGRAAYDLAAGLTGVPTNAATITALAPFRSLTAGEVAVLPANIQFYVPTISCAQLDARDPVYLINFGYLSQHVAACGPADSARGRQKFLLGSSAVDPLEVVAADSRYDRDHGGWYVNAYVSGDAASAWHSFTEAHIGDRIAFLVDAAVLSAPQLTSALDAPIWFTQLDRVTAARFATVLDNGPLPVEFTVTDLRQ